MSEKTTATDKLSGNSKSDRAVSRHNAEHVGRVEEPLVGFPYIQRKLGNQAVQRLFKSGAIQAKLRIGAPNDKYEQEADRVADQVMRMPDESAASIQRSAISKGKESTIQLKPG